MGIKIKRNEKFVGLHWSHIFAVCLLGGYFIVSKLNSFHAMSRGDIVGSFVQLYLFGIFFACLFLYIFSNDKFFAFAREIEKNQKAKEKRYLNKYLHHGKVLATLIIGSLGGPVFSSLTARLLLNKYWYKYLVVILANVPSTLFSVGIGHSLIKVLNF